MNLKNTFDSLPISSQIFAKSYTKAIAKINEQKLFAIKVRNIADISNKRVAYKQHYLNFFHQID